MREMGPETVCGGRLCVVAGTVPRRGLCPGGDCTGKTWTGGDADEENRI